MKKVMILGKIVLQGVAILVVLAGLTLLGTVVYKAVAGTNVPSNDKDALVHHIKECDDNKIDNCFDAGVYYLKGRGTTANTAKAAAYFAKACELGDKEACEKAKVIGNMAKLENDIKGKSIEEMSDDEKRRFGEMFSQILKPHEGK